MKEFHPCPKPPTDKKKQKPANGYKDKMNRYCFYTGKSSAERHEVFGGPNREISIRNGFQIDLCSEIHEHFTNPTSHEDLVRIRFWREYFQMKYEHSLMSQGMPFKKVREAWEMLIGENFLER